MFVFFCVLFVISFVFCLFVFVLFVMSFLVSLRVRACVSCMRLLSELLLVSANVNSFLLYKHIS